MKLIALVPMRHRSQRVPGKNYRDLAGKPLYQHIIEMLLAVPEVDEIVVDTDSEPVMNGLRETFSYERERKTNIGTGRDVEPIKYE
jgi:CMP-N-acetylneuraminic acid synthetase